MAKAEKPGGIGQDYVIRYDSISYLMKPGELFSDRHELNFIITRSGEVFGAIYQNPSRFLLNIEMGDELPVVIQCFIFWLAYRLWICERGWARSVLGARFLR